MRNEVLLLRFARARSAGGASGEEPSRGGFHVWYLTFDAQALVDLDKQGALAPQPRPGLPPLLRREAHPL
jgi:hypothetical protein